jgi:hypothetical protein
METIKSEMKEMVYGSDDGCLYLEIDLDGYGLMVVNVRGSHPCAYVTFPGIDKIKDYETVELEQEKDEDYLPHEGFTFFGERERYCEVEGILWLGWDYAHFGDYIYCGYDGPWRSKDKKWTTTEIVDEARRVLNKIKNGKFTY